MKFVLSYALVLVWLAYLIASGVYLFSKGFLLSRVSNTDVSSCRHLSLDSNDDYTLTEELVQEIFKDVNASSNNLCLPQKSKVIILVIDALKYEFGIFKEDLLQPLPYENKLSVLHELTRNMPEQSRLMRFKADPPTTTLQRLKGLTTGTLPTFVDIGSNFATPEINEDNVIDQMVRSHLPIVFLGDSTWTELFPRRFKRSYSYPSFDIFDLDTVDRNIEKNLPLELKRDDWQVLIAHFLGVDHCGHKYGPLHDEMSRKLTEMNEVIRNVVTQMDEKTTLLLLGDHGMTVSGDHGGDTDDETNALLFAYTKQSKFLSDVGSDNTTMQQIDLVPTLATILGIPIPYSNLGIINFNIVPNVAVPYMTKIQVLILHVWQNAQQVYKYFFSYALENKRTFNVEEMDRLETEFILLTHRVKTIYNEAAFKSFFGDLNINLRLVLTTCREIWVKFDATQMSQGLLVTFLPIFFSFILINNTRSIDFLKIFTLKEMGYTYLLNFAAAVFGYRYYKNFSFKTEEHGIIFFTNMLSTLILVFHTVQNWSTIANNWSKVKRVGNFPTRVILIILVGVFFSNSFIIQEGKILSYLLVAVILLMVYELFQKSVRVEFKNKFKFQQFLKSTAFKLFAASFLAIALIRFATSLFRCREEQGNCSDFTNNDNLDGISLKRPSSAKAFILSVVVIVIYTTLSRIYLRACGNLTGNCVNVLVARYGPTVASICAGGHILLSHSSIKNIQRIHIDAMALVIYTLLIVQIIVVTMWPLMVYVLPPKSSSTITVNRTDSVVPEIFRKMKRMYEDDDAERHNEIPVVYGLATIYSSVIISFGTFLAMVLIVILEPKSSMGIIVCIAVGAIILSLHAILRYRTAISFETCIQPTFTAIVAWFLLAHFCFFATSHQTTLSQIDWQAAFVGRTTSIGQSNFISAVLVILNTFCGHVFFFCMYGLLSTETFSIFALFPKLIKTNFNREQRKTDTPGVGRPPMANATTSDRSLCDISYECVGFDMTRGELVLFEQEATFIGTVFKLATQFYILQGIKVFCSMLACTIHCRHLMVWKIFAPRFIYESIATFISMPAIIIGFLLIIRIHKGVDTLISKINKIK